jgi:hypothetical protein
VFLSYTPIIAYGRNKLGALRLTREDELYHWPQIKTFRAIVRPLANLTPGKNGNIGKLPVSKSGCTVKTHTASGNASGNRIYAAFPVSNLYV